MACGMWSTFVNSLAKAEHEFFNPTLGSTRNAEKHNTRKSETPSALGGRVVPPPPPPPPPTFYERPLSPPPPPPPPLSPPQSSPSPKGKISLPPPM
eukprot:CAMPEP_0116562208 /NCGR_PEP_ID=MMETSP0397-20121206/12030_1 /TAXON_ID=216820 /ORGANISM="Cyclophora tenuis, Strain ECT3854" /LENGTH=95 /DNA_ID=CAMNT_0004088475 /DNA_START=59 /DNA_END=346 /DNA_ORIENTATION=+